MTVLLRKELFQNCQKKIDFSESKYISFVSLLQTLNGKRYRDFSRERKIRRRICKSRKWARKRREKIQMESLGESRDGIHFCGTYREISTEFIGKKSTTIAMSVEYCGSFNSLHFLASNMHRLCFILSQRAIFIKCPKL